MFITSTSKRKCQSVRCLRAVLSSVVAMRRGGYWEPDMWLIWIERCSVCKIHRRISKTQYQKQRKRRGGKWGWRDALAVKSTGCLSHPHRGSQPSVTPISEYPMAFSGLQGHQAHTWCTCVHTSKTPIHIKYFLREELHQKFWSVATNRND